MFSTGEVAGRGGMEVSQINYFFQYFRFFREEAREEETKVKLRVSWRDPLNKSEQMNKGVIICIKIT